MTTIAQHDPLAVAVVAAIRSGDVEWLRQQLADTPWLATVRVLEAPNPPGRQVSRTLLHVVTDWPGHFPNGPRMVAMLAAAGADVNARIQGPNTETPLQWAASTDDVGVLDALLDHHADIEADGAVIGGGTALADAVAFRQWRAARRLVERGAKTTLWQAAALGLLDRVQAHFAGCPLPPWQFGPAYPGGETPDEATHAFWCACHGGQLSTAEFLASRGVQLNWIGYDRLTPLEAARRAGVPDLVDWLVARGAKVAAELPRRST